MPNHLGPQLMTFRLAYKRPVGASHYFKETIMSDWKPTDTQIENVAVELTKHVRGSSHVNPVSVAMNLKLAEKLITQVHDEYPFVIEGLLK